MNPIPIREGMLLHVIPSEKFTTRMICVLLRRPLSRQEATMNALLPMVLRRGSARYPAQTDVALAAERLRGAVFESQIIKKGEQQILQFYFECADGDDCLTTNGLSFIKEMTLAPLTEGEGFKQAYVRGEAENLRNLIEGRINNKSEYAKLKCLEFMCEGEPFGIYGDGYAEDLEGITPTGLLRHYKKMIATSPIDFIAIGRWDEQRLCENLADLFNPYRDGIIPVSNSAAKPGRGKPRIERLDIGAVQGNLCAGLRGRIESTGEQYLAFQLANEILGGGPKSKLFAYAREKESLCYYISSFIYRFKSLMCIQCGADAAQLDHILDLTEEQLNALKQGCFSSEEMDCAKRSLTKEWRALQDDISSCADFYASQYLLGDNNTIEDLCAGLNNISRDAVAEAANKLMIDTVVMAR